MRRSNSVQQTFRQFLTAAGFTLTMVGVLSLGLGLGTYVFGSPASPVAQLFADEISVSAPLESTLDGSFIRSSDCLIQSHG